MNKVRIAVSSQGENLEAPVDSRFGRASKFLIVDSDTMEFGVIENLKHMDLSQGAGIQTAQNVLSHQPDVVITGNCGPKAFKVLETAGVKVVVGATGSIAEAVQGYLDGKLEPAEAANVDGHWV